jgi:hypothetical protein
MPDSTGDALGGHGNGQFWYAADDAALTDHALYQSYSNTKLGALDVNAVKASLAVSYGSTEAAPIINYLRWLIDTLAAFA